jgi:hypothetical protein
MEISWYNLAQLEGLGHDIEGLLNVTTDACANEVCPPNPEDLATTLQVVLDKVTEMNEVIEDVFREARAAREKAAEEAAEEDDEEDDEEDPIPQSFGTLSVTEAEDGVFTFTASEAEMNRIFSAFITAAIIKGLEAQENENESWAELRKAAEDLERFLIVWEDSEEFDYDPDVKEKRVALSNVLHK